MPQTSTPLLLGAHISIAGGPDQAIHRGESIGCTAIQIFTKSNRQWFAKPLTPETVEAFKQAWKQSGIQSVIAHAAYLINLGSSNPETLSKSAEALADELKRCDQLGIPYLVLHPGSAGDTPEDQALQQVAQQLNEVFKATPGNTTILLETMAGQGTNLCYRLEQIASIYQASNYKERLGVCLDTCHVFAAGYDLRTPQTYKAFWEQFNTILGLDLLKAIHINDSKKALGSRADRHEHIGKGAIGLDAFRLLFTDSQLAHIPKVLETPKESLEDDARNMAVIRDLI
ncbi:deoxyribonuclease IV [Candidatus Dependentiae bacterium]|nr:MAG: deoxyribonuclease IV [Candidatus Dependentiae bacterium]